MITPWNTKLEWFDVREKLPDGDSFGSLWIATDAGVKKAPYRPSEPNTIGGFVRGGHHFAKVYKWAWMPYPDMPDISDWTEPEPAARVEVRQPVESCTIEEFVAGLEKVKEQYGNLQVFGRPYQFGRYCVVEADDIRVDFPTEERYETPDTIIIKEYPRRVQL